MFKCTAARSLPSFAGIEEKSHRIAPLCRSSDILFAVPGMSGSQLVSRLNSMRDSCNITVRHPLACTVGKSTILFGPE